MWVGGGGEEDCKGLTGWKMVVEGIAWIVWNAEHARESMWCRVWLFYVKRRTVSGKVYGETRSHDARTPCPLDRR